jgi:TRAP transporter 4TM/12TM fusion protein
MSTEAIERYRVLSPAFLRLTQALKISTIFFAAIYALEIHLLMGFSFSSQQFLGMMLGLVLTIVFITAPPSAKQDRTYLPWYDVVMAGLGLACGIYVMIWFPKLASTVMFPRFDKYFFGSVAALLVLEATRRLYGSVLVIITGAFILYARFSDYFPGLLKSKGIVWTHLAGNLFLGSNSMFGSPMEIISTVVVAFIIFGTLLFAVGGGTLFTDFAIATMGRYRGGPAKVSVVASCMFGTISGSAIANVVVDGWITIPLMKNIGYRPAVASAVEACASTGGIIMPPVMGAVAFIMADFLQIPYYQVALAAVIPALLYYGSLLIQVDLEAARTGMKGLPGDQLPKLKGIILRGWPFLLPLAVLLFTLLVLFWQPAKSAIASSILAVIVGSIFVKAQGFRWWLTELAKAGQQAAEIVVIGALVGLIIGCSDLTGLGFSLTLILYKVGQVNILLFLVVTAIMSLILGMGLPGIAIYLMQATLIVPAMVKMGIAPISAHFFIMYFGCFAMITPPVALAAMAAAAIGKADLWETGWEAVKLSIIAFIIPFMFVLSPSLLFQGKLDLILINALTAGLGVIAIGAGLRGFFFSSVGPLGRTLLLLSAVSLILPVGVFPLAWAVNLVGGIISIAILTANYMKRRSGRLSATAPA